MIPYPVARHGGYQNEAIGALREGAEAFVECMQQHGDQIPTYEIETDAPRTEEVVAVAI